MMQQEQPQKNENRPTSIGGKIFDAITYPGVAGVGTFFVTIFAANLFKEGGRFHGFDQGMRRTLQKWTGSEFLAHKITDTTNLMHGGNLMLIPVGMLEHFRTPIVNGLNRMFNDPTDPKSVQEAPPQTMGSILLGRGVAWSVVFGAFTGTELAIGKQRFDGILDQAGKTYAQWRKKPVHIPDVKTGKLIKSPHYNFGHSGALDVLATVASVSLLYTTSHFFARKAQEKKLEKTGKEPPVTTYDTASHHTVSADAPDTIVSQVERTPDRVAQAPALATAQG